MEEGFESWVMFDLNINVVFMVPMHMVVQVPFPPSIRITFCDIERDEMPSA